jgi:cytochrome c oxidase assembly protein subunit 11
MTDVSHPAQSNGNHRTAAVLAGVVVAMIGAAYAAVPLYQLFCQVTGFGGTPQTASGNPKGVIERQMTVRFDSNVGGDLAWSVAPAKPVTDRIGTVETVTYVATNHSSRRVTGHAVFNVTPEIAGVYFNKIECFCFTEQTLQPGETVEMPVTFFVDPDIAQNGDLDTIRAITLSYTFYAQNAEEI